MQSTGSSKANGLAHINDSGISDYSLIFEIRRKLDKLLYKWDDEQELIRR